MTRYDEPPASDGHGGPHPLAGVPQAALDAAATALTEALTSDSASSYCLLDPAEVPAVAEAVLASALAAWVLPVDPSGDPDDNPLLRRIPDEYEPVAAQFVLNLAAVGMFVSDTGRRLALQRAATTNDDYDRWIAGRHASGPDLSVTGTLPVEIRVHRPMTVVLNGRTTHLTTDDTVRVTQ